MKPRTVVLWLVFLGFGAFVTWSVMKQSQIGCELCITFDGRRLCRSAAAPTRDEAIGAATTAACALLAGGMSDGLRCNRTPPDKLACK